MKLLNKFVAAAALFAILIAPAGNMSAAYVTESDIPAEGVYEDTSYGYEESRDSSAFVSPYVALGAIAVVAIIAIAVSDSGHSGHGHGHSHSE